MTAVQGALLVAGYSRVIGAPVAILAWELLQRPGGYTGQVATAVTAVMAIALLGPPWIGYTLDALQPNETCNGECYEFVRSWMAMWLGIGLAGVVLIGALVASPMVRGRA